MTLNLKKLEGYLISIEGGDGSGKGTLVNNLIKLLSNLEINFVYTREPGGTPVAEKIREIIVNENIDAVTEMLLFAASRREVVEKVIRPALKENKLVIVDRYIDSSLVYQGIARGLGVGTVLNINKHSINELMPHKTIYLDIDPKIALDRLSTNNRETNRLDLESINFHNKTREGYLMLAKQCPDRYLVINANQPPEDVFNEVLNKLLNND